MKGDYNLMDSIRPMSLSQQELDIFEDFIRKHTPEVEEDTIMEEEIDSLAITATLIGKKKLDEEGDDQEETTKPHHNYLKESWDLIEDNLFSSLSSSSEKSYIRLSPILDPQYVSYSRSKGFSYKMKLYAGYKYSKKSWIDFHPRIGYNFKLREFYFDAPLQYVYNADLDAGIDACFSKDNRIGNASVLEEIKKEYPFIKFL